VQPFSGGIIEVRMDGRHSEARFCPDFLIHVDQSATQFSVTAVPVGKYRLYATLQKDTGDCDYCSGEPRYIFRREIEIGSGGDRSLRVEFYPGAQVNGAIHWDRIPPVSFGQATVALIGEHESYYNEARENIASSIVMSRVQPGTYHVRVTGSHPAFPVREVRLNGTKLDSGVVAVTPETGELRLDIYLGAPSGH
jgi:hypothetical protein